jgi:hypothetical protein
MWRRSRRSEIRVEDEAKRGMKRRERGESKTYSYRSDKARDVKINHCKKEWGLAGGCCECHM